MWNILILLWKNLLMRKNHYIATALEIIVPISLLILANVSLPKYPVEINNDLITFGGFNSNNCHLRHGHYDNILYSPSTPFIKDLMKRAACYAGYKESSVKPGNLTDMVNFFSVGVYFHSAENDSGISEGLNYTIYPTSEVWKSLNKLWRQFDSLIPRYSIPLLRNVIEIQRAIDVSYLRIKNISANLINIENTDLYDRSPRIFSVVIFLALIFAFTLIAPPIIGRVVQEKYTGAKELMLMMGVKKWELWISKFIDSYIFVIITVSGMIFFMYVPLKSESNVLTIPFYTVAVIMLYGLISVILFLFFISCFFEKANLAVFVGEAIWCFTFLLSNYLSSLSNLPSFCKYVTHIFPHVVLMNGIAALLAFDTYEKELKFTENLSDDDEYFTLVETFVMMTFNIGLYAGLTWYLEEVKPGKFGMAKPYGFCFKKSYWFPEKVDTTYYGNHCNNFTGRFPTANPNYEPVPENLRKGISIHKVTKIFKSVGKAPVLAVDDISIDFYHGEISALLGHNGAGKTTMFSMITGLVNPTSGSVSINGYNLALNTHEARQSLGLCPQKDMLFDDLTVLQILKFYGVMKGLSLSEAAEEMKELVNKLKLEKVKNTQTKNLSGGQKRKVSLAIALIGGSQVLVLDEPTSGMDPEIRREIWEMLLGFRGARTILITTHFMEEADVLCDRIAIMDRGRIRCFGSSMYLKSKYGKGYVLSVVMNDVEQVHKITDEIRRFVPSAKFKSQNVRTVSFELPESEVATFPDLLSDLDRKQVENEIVSYSITVASLEDVFLKLRSKSQEADGFDCTDTARYVNLLNEDDNASTKFTDFLLFPYQFWALLIKNWIFLCHQWKIFLVYLLLAGALVVLTTLVSGDSQSKKEINFRDSAPIPFSTDLYSPFLVLYSNPDEISDIVEFPDYVKELRCDVREVRDIKKEINRIFKNDFQEYAKILNLGVEFRKNQTTIYHNDRAIHMIPIALNLIHNFLLKINNVSNGIDADISIQYVRKVRLFARRSQTKCILPDVPDFTGTHTFFYFLAPLKESIFGAKEIQLMMTPTALYWLSHLVLDLGTFLMFLIAACLWFGFSQENGLMLEYSDEVFLSLFFWAVGMILVAYVISSLFKAESGALTASIFIYVIFTFVLNNTFSTFSLPKFVYYLHPTPILKHGLRKVCDGKKSLTALGLFFYDITLFGLLVVKDSKVLSQIFHSFINRFLKIDYASSKEIDELVQREKAEVNRLITKGKSSGFSLIVSDLKKWYLKGLKPSPTVRGISFTVKEGECFGLLGVNGAGKTTTFKMLTGSIPSSGGITHLRSEILTIFNRQKYFFQMGYCPQSEGFIPALNGRELLTFFARMRGIKRPYLTEEVEKWLEKLELLDFAEQKCGSYSGGNQRKLSTAIALVGDSPLIFLDEPTSGVDPGSRRLMWNVVDDVQKKGQSVVLTSHCMDECEALCSRLAIMVNGRFRCLGEITTLKKRFGQGYTVQVKVSCGTPRESVSALKSSMAEAFGPDCTLIDEHLTILQYHVPKDSVSWANLFSKLKILKEKFEFLESYTASETTLEQIFIYLARNQQ